MSLTTYTSPSLEDVMVKLTKFSQFDQICQTLPWRPRGWGRCKWSNSSKIIKRVTKLKCIGFKVPKTALFDPVGTILEKVSNFENPIFHLKKCWTSRGRPRRCGRRGWSCLLKIINLVLKLLCKSIKTKKSGRLGGKKKLLKNWSNP